MLAIISLLLLFFLGKTVSILDQNDPIVNTTLGSIRGIIQTSRKGNEFYSFRGIRYARAPIGNLRLKPPIPVAPWGVEILNAVEDGPACYQPKFSKVSEDCLHLNVYTHHISQNIRRPVLVYIHGGRYISLSGQSTVFGPDYLMDHDMVLVTVNYRLGTLGFFSTGDEHIPGNFGMKDQVLALEWVQANIKFFGGDPSKVTISGESAGGASVGLHLVSPMSRGLFHKAMLLSGSGTNSWSINKNPFDLAKKQAKLLNCSNDDTSEKIKDCIMNLPAENVTNVVDLMYLDNIGNSEIISEWNKQGPINAPVIEVSTNESERFLTKDPLISILEGDIADVPIFIGTTKDEMIETAFGVAYNDKWSADLSENWTTIAPIIFHYERNDTISEKIREFYFGNINESFTKNSLNSLNNLLSDNFITFGVVRSAKLIADKNTSPVYLYQFNYVGEAMESKPDVKWKNRVAHGDDMFYVFYMPIFFPFKFNASSVDGRFVNKYTLLWKNFVTTGNPTEEAVEALDNVLWKPFTTADPSYLDIHRTLTLKRGLHDEKRILLWESIFPLTFKKNDTEHFRYRNHHDKNSF